MPPNLADTERTTVVTAVMVRVTTDFTAALTADCAVGVAGTSTLAVVVQPATGFCGLLQLVKVCVDFTWQQPQSWDLALWSGPSAPLVPWLL